MPLLTQRLQFQNWPPWNVNKFSLKHGENLTFVNAHVFMGVSADIFVNIFCTLAAKPRLYQHAVLEDSSMGHNGITVFMSYGAY